MGKLARGGDRSEHAAGKIADRHNAGMTGRRRQTHAGCAGGTGGAARRTLSCLIDLRHLQNRMA